MKENYNDITEFIYLAENADKITAVIDKYGFYVMLGNEEKFIEDYFKEVDEFTKKRLINSIKYINPIIHNEFGLI